MPPETLHFPPSQAALLAPYLPSTTSTTSSSRPHLTLTFATSLDSALSLRPGTQTALSGPESKAMTHYLRSRHSAILIGAGTAVADDPGLNCRIAGCASQPRPVVLDPSARWQVGDGSKVVRLAREGAGLAPFVVVRAGVEVSRERRAVLERVGGRYIPAPCEEGGGFAWRDVLAVLEREGLDSVMVEGGGAVINSLLAGANLRLVDSVIVTIAPTWLGKGGVVVSPHRPGGEDGTEPAARLVGVKWCPLGEDVVLCGRPA
ncbi:bacterial bifunctional deaminase-reductase [Coniochaeta ligniaria NRRL 30616]|uniref:2,5-diamino-6-ribosylamino-4(3H)-pyrimidinone 5'-phosphate reductase n=1 Tax=Coniochaeta ligniaria NRRL 30616 TaxID=1408157 RepID=A0A1J7JFR6_9PEZI|nr:bacterial bifunctional deaminase-reductase [Coniochaeta ligniaria NRRL 30616]